MVLAILSDTQILDNLSAQKKLYVDEYYAFYSSWYGGVTTNPSMMLLPIDDHMVHRGDGVFEAMKAIDRAVYMLDEHLHRLLKSANAISLIPSFSFDEMKHIILETLKIADKNDVYVRLFLSRGPGNFSVNPYDSVSSQLYVVITKYKPLPENKYSDGATIAMSTIPVKDTWMAQVKSCNYLPNVMMKKEAVDRHVDFVIGIDEHGFVTESATENILMVDADGIIVCPKLNYVLKGTTMLRTCELAQQQGMKVEFRHFTPDELLSAREVMMSGTTLDILPVVKFEGNTIADGKPGAIAAQLRQLMMEDMRSGSLSTRY